MIRHQMKMGILSAMLLLSVLSEAQIPEIPSLFLGDDVSTRYNERDMAISPDGSEMFYTLVGNQNSFSVIVHRKKLSNGKWSSPEVASFSGKYGDLEAAFSADGKKVFFSSNRPVEGDKVKDYDIWYVEKINGVWANPKNLGPTINSPWNEFYPSLGASGNLYFTAEYKSGVGKEDIFLAAWKDGKYEPPVVLDTAVNSILWEFNAFVSPDEKLIIFTSYGRADDSGGGDLYISVKDDQGKWQSAKNIKMLNSIRLDYCPFVSFDRSILFFTSGKHGIPKPFEKAQTYDELMKTLNQPENASENIYWVSFKKVLESTK
ncbi:MAG TPA: hypothetical protein VGK59_01615 [Ohtaekwangia sp.]